MTDHIRIQIKAYLRSKYGEIVHFKTFDTTVSANNVLEEILTIKKDIVRIQMDRDYDERDFYSI
jgi:hypothetical protein